MAANRTIVFIGGYSEDIRLGTGQLVQGKSVGIDAYELNEESGTLVHLTSVAERNPSYLVLSSDGKYLYATNELKEYQGQASSAAAAYAWENDELRLLNRYPTWGTDAAHLIVDAQDKFLYVTNFMSGSTCVFPINEDGSLSTPSCFLQHKGSSVNEKRQAGPHAHATEFNKDQSLALVSDLGCDKIFIYKTNEMGYLSYAEPASINMKPGSGPRHCVFHPEYRYLCSINEMTSSIDVFDWNDGNPVQEPVQHISTLPEDFTEHSSCAAIKFDPAGKFLYASNRGHNSIAVYAFDAEAGQLTLTGHFSSGGEIPRDFDITPDGKFLICSNQASGNLVVFSIDAETGALTELSRIEGVGTPTCVAAFTY